MGGGEMSTASVREGGDDERVLLADPDDLGGPVRVRRREGLSGQCANARGYPRASVFLRGQETIGSVLFLGNTQVLSGVAVRDAGWIITSFVVRNGEGGLWAAGDRCPEGWGVMQVQGAKRKSSSAFQKKRKLWKFSLFRKHPEVVRNHLALAQDAPMEIHAAMRGRRVTI